MNRAPESRPDLSTLCLTYRAPEARVWSLEDPKIFKPAFVPEVVYFD
jgi:hypothetical protein